MIRHKTNFEILEGNKVLEVKCGKYDKGQAAHSLIFGYEYDYVFAAGDDKTDEFLFRALPDTAFTIRVGISPSIARYNTANIDVLHRLLKS